MPHPPPDKRPFEPDAAITLGRMLRERRKALGVSATAAAEAAQVSRVTWHRLEKGETTVALGSLLAAAHVLKMELRLQAPGEEAAESVGPLDAALPLRIGLADYPQLRRLAWQVGDEAQALSPLEALGLYERNWRHLQPELLEPGEQALIQALRQVYGEDRLRV